MITTPFSGGGYAFYTGIFSSVEAVPFTVMLDGHTYAVDLEKYRRSSQETLRDGVVQSNEPNDVLFNAQGAWSRYRYSWFHGAGQTFGDLRDDADPFRFDSSNALDVWTDGELRLHRAMTRAQATTATTIPMCRVGSYVFIGNGTTLYRTSDFVSFTTCTAPGGDVQALTTDGTDLYVATSTVMKKYVAAATTPTAFSTAVTGNCTNVAFVANRLLLAKANILYEVAGTGALTTLRTHYQSAFTWSTIFNIGSRIYIGGYAGTRSELYTCVVDDTGVIVQGAEAAPLPMGELLYYGLSTAGVAVLGTNKGCRMAVLASDGTLTYGPLIAEGSGSRAAAVDGKYVYFDVDSYNGGGLGRMDLSTLTDTLQPAWAYDVSTADAVTITGVAVLDDIVAFGGYDGVYAKSADYEPWGSLDSGWITFGTVEPKGLIALEVVFLALDDGASVTASIYNQAGVLIGSRTMNNDGETSLTVDLNGIQVEKIWIRLELEQTTNSTPVVTRWRIRGFPVAPPVQQWVVPLQIFSVNVVNSGMGQEWSLEQREEVEHIIDLWASKRAVLYREGARAFNVRVDAYEWAPHEWRDAGDFYDGWMTVRLVEA